MYIHIFIFVILLLLLCHVTVLKEGGAFVGTSCVVYSNILSTNEHV